MLFKDIQKLANNNSLLKNKIYRDENNTTWKALNSNTIVQSFTNGNTLVQEVADLKITVSTTAPTNPKLNQLWVDIS